MTSTILIADDDPVQRRLLEAMTRRFGYEVETVESGEQALSRMNQAGAPPIALLVLDLVMPDLDGMGVLGRMRDLKLTTPVIVQTANGSIETVISAMRAGAQDFVVKPVGAERLQISIKNALSIDALAGEMRRVSKRSQGLLTFKDLVSRSPEMARVIRLGERSAHSTIPVLIEGESGVGKEIVARAIQGASDRRGKPFITVNCGALPANLVESILFGHEKGAFTGATEKHVGKFLEANGGTLFLDEIGELPLDLQVKLLRALQEGEVDPIGAKRPVRVDVQADLGDQSKSDRTGQARAVSRGFVLPAQRVSDRHSAAALAPRGYSRSRAALLRALRRRGRPQHSRRRRRGPVAALDI